MVSRARLSVLERQLHSQEKIISGLTQTLSLLKAEINEMKSQSATGETVDCSHCERAAEASEIKSCSKCGRNYCNECQNAAGMLCVVRKCWECEKWFCGEESCQDRSYACDYKHECIKV